MMKRLRRNAEGGCSILDIDIQRIKKEELQQSIDDLKDRGWEQVCEIVKERHSPKMFTAAERKRFAFDGNAQSVMYKVKMRSPHVTPQRADITKRFNIAQLDVLSMLRELLTTEEKARKQYERLACRHEKDLSEIEVLKLDNKILRERLKSIENSTVKPKPVVQNSLKTTQVTHEAVIEHSGRKILVGTFNTQEKARDAEKKAKAVLIS